MIYSRKSFIDEKFKMTIAVIINSKSISFISDSIFKAII